MNQIFDFYKKQKGEDLNSYEMYQIGKYFLPYFIPISDIQIKINNASVNEAIYNVEHFPEKMPNLKIFQYKNSEKKEISIKNLHYQSLLDYKNGEISKEIVNYIEKFI